jgi:3-oxoacyl-[acyl-carrier-protein] synthase-3
MLKIKGSGRYLPRRVVTSLELDERLGLAGGTFENASGVRSRRYADADESPSFMGAQAAYAALEDAGMKFADIDLILGACGTAEQAIPCTAALVQRAMEQENSGVPCFDVNSTCLSFVTALQVARSFLALGTYKNILIVSSEVASVGLNYKHLESASLFGDGAAAFVVSRAPAGERSAMLAYKMVTYSSGWDTCQIAGGGSQNHPSRMDWSLERDDERFLFSMNGPKVFKLAAKYMDDFVEGLEEEAGMRLADAKVLIPHQASESAMELIRRRLGLPPEQMVKIIGEHGNMIAASIPLALHYSLQNGTLVDGDVAFLIGTSAGFSIGGAVIRV